MSVVSFAEDSFIFKFVFFYLVHTCNDCIKFFWLQPQYNLSIGLHYLLENNFCFWSFICWGILDLSWILLMLCCRVFEFYFHPMKCYYFCFYQLTWLYSNYTLSWAPALISGFFFSSWIGCCFLYPGVSSLELKTNFVKYF